MRPQAQLRKSNGSNALKMAVHQWRVIPAREDHPQAERRKWLIKSAKSAGGISTGSGYSILTEDLNLRKVSAKFGPKLPTEQQKEISEDMLDLANHDPEFIKTIITGDETWVYGYDPETKFQSSKWKHPESPQPKKARQVRSNVKVM